MIDLPPSCSLTHASCPCQKCPPGPPLPSVFLPPYPSTCSGVGMPTELYNPKCVRILVVVAWSASSMINEKQWWHISGLLDCRCHWELSLLAFQRWVRDPCNPGPGDRSWETPPLILLNIGRDACRLQARAAERVEATASEARSNFTIRVSFILTTLR